jgi:uncharacterized membrane protein YphA (DoxX/SURF4 family)
MNITLWIAQIVLAIVFAGAGTIKLSKTKAEVIKKLGDWANDLSQTQIKLIGTVEWLGALGMILPQWTGILPVLTPIAAIGLVLTMIGAAVTHLRRKEFSDVPMTVILLALAAFVAYGRF